MALQQPSTDVRSTTGRPPVTSTDELCQIAIELFVSQGFEETSIDDITTAAGIGRRTFFRYFETKADAVWGDFDSAIIGLRTSLDSSPTSVPMMDSLRIAVVAFNHLPQDQVQQHRQRMQLILRVPTLISRSSLRYAQWRAAIEEFASRRLNLPADHLIPRSIGYTALGVALAAHEQWLQDETSDLGELLNSAFLALSQGFSPEYINHTKGNS